MVYTTRNPVSGTTSYGAEGEKIDHRKRRRNRVRASCLNCYASKRKCDKKRPCTRCVRLGNTAFCVYETDEPYIPFSDHTQLDEIKQLRHRIVELEGIVRKIKQPYSKRLLPNEMHPDGFVHFRPNLPYTGDTCSTFNPLGPVHDVSLKQERVVYNSNSALTDNKIFESNNFNERLPDSEQMGVNNYVLATSSHDSASSSCTSCSDRSPYSPLHHDMGTGFRYDSKPLPARTLRTVTASEGETLSRISYTYDSSPPHSLSTGNYSPAMTYQSPSPVTESHCPCLKDPQSLAPLVNLGFALRTSLEVLEKVHSHGSYCGLFSYISFLENHIFSLRAPQERPGNSHVDSNAQTFSPMASSYTTQTPTGL